MSRFPERSGQVPSKRLERDLENASRYLDQSISESTRRVYRIGWEDFTDYCEEVGADPLPASPEVVAGYIVARAEERPNERGVSSEARARQGLSNSTLKGRLAAIRYVHRRAGHANPADHPQVRTLLAGTIRDTERQQGLPKVKAQPIRSAHLEDMLELMPWGEPPSTDSPMEWAKWLRGTRDRAIFLFSFASSMRPSEVVATRLEHLDWREEGLIVHVPRSKTDQEGEGMVKTIAQGARPRFCPLQNVRRWISYAQIEDGPLFRGVRNTGEIRDEALTYRAFNDLVTRWIERANLEAQDLGGKPRRFSPHSFRAGHITEAHEQGAPEQDIMAQSGHKDLDTFRGYIRPAQQLESSSSRYLEIYE